MWPEWLDAVLIYGYRIPENPMLGFCLGTAILALLTVLCGELTTAAALLINREHIRDGNEEVVRMHNLSMEALEVGDKAGYTACNKQANDAFGRSFFFQIALGAGMLWPIPLALHWMGERFAGIPFELPFSLPLAGAGVGYAFPFLLLYILMRILFKQVRRRLPFFRRVHEQLQLMGKGAKMRPLPGTADPDG
jgi:hypothetical protein